MCSADFTYNSFVYRLSFRPTGRRLSCRLLVCVSVNDNGVALNTVVSPSVNDLKLLCCALFILLALMGNRVFIMCVVGKALACEEHRS